MARVQIRNKKLAVVQPEKSISDEKPLHEEKCDRYSAKPHPRVVSRRLSSGNFAIVDKSKIQSNLTTFT